MRNRRRDLQGVVDRFRRSQLSSLLDDLTQIRTANEFERDEVQTLIFTDEKYPCDIVVIQLCRGLSLIAEALHRGQIA